MAVKAICASEPRRRTRSVVPSGPSIGSGRSVAELFGKKHFLDRAGIERLLEDGQHSQPALLADLPEVLQDDETLIADELYGALVAGLAERLQRLQAVVTSHQRNFNAGFAGRTIDVLLEKPGRLLGQLVGRSPYLQAVQVMAPHNMMGSIEGVTITEVGSNSLFGILETPEPVLATAGA